MMRLFLFCSKASMHLSRTDTQVFVRSPLVCTFERSARPPAGAIAGEGGGRPTHPFTQQRLAPRSAGDRRRDGMRVALVREARK